MRALLPTSIPIIGCGGISNGDDAVDFLKAGANMVQAYTAFGYTGVGFARKVKDEIAANLERQSTTWKAEVEKNRQNWVEGANRLDRQLKTEVSRLKQAMSTAPMLIPVEDLVAAQGLDPDDLSARREDSSRIFGSMRTIAKSNDRDTSGIVSTAMDNLDASLHPFVSAVLGMTKDLPDVHSEPPNAATSNRGVHNHLPAEAASVSLVDDVSWRESVNQGDRRLV